MKYINFLQYKNILEPTIEQFEVQELQGVSGLKAIRVKINNENKGQISQKYSYQELLNELN